MAGLIASTCDTSHFEVVNPTHSSLATATTSRTTDDHISNRFQVFNVRASHGRQVPVKADNWNDLWRYRLGLLQLPCNATGDPMQRPRPALAACRCALCSLYQARLLNTRIIRLIWFTVNNYHHSAILCTDVRAL